MLSPLSLLLSAVLVAVPAVYGHAGSHLHRGDTQTPLASPTRAINSVPFSVRAYWMRQANLALQAPCPFAAFGAVIVNHTATTTDGRGQLVCTGANSNTAMGNPAMHGEIAAITNCSAILTDPQGPYNLTGTKAQAAFADLTLYTNAESCPMCAAAIRWAGFREYVYGTSIDTLIDEGWGQIRISSMEVFRQSFDLPYPSRLLAEVLTNETDPYFLWQYNPDYPCPAGCARVKGSCAAL